MSRYYSHYAKYADIIHLRRPISRHIPMTIANRAKIFAPFAALTGFENCVHKKEEIYIPAKELSDERAAEINQHLCSLKAHDEVTLVYFHPIQTRADYAPYASGLAQSNLNRSPATPDHERYDSAHAQSDSARGQYETIKGRVDWIHPHDRKLKVDSIEIAFDFIINLQVSPAASTDRTY